MADFMRRLSYPLARLSLFIVFFWFGALKLFGYSPANELVRSLLGKLLPFAAYDVFVLALGIYEMLIGICFLVPKWERVGIILLLPHMASTALPLIFLTSITWQSFFVPTLEGQYIIKNVVILALAISMSSHLNPAHERSREKNKYKNHLFAKHFHAKIKDVPHN
jgi:uncharacterized membrane protein YkgB